MATAVFQSATGNPYIDGVLSGVKWSGTVTYSFPDSPSDYPAGYGSGEPLNQFQQLTAVQQQAVHSIMQQIVNYTNLTITFAGTDGADIRLAESADANPTAYAYYPSSNEGGDVWFGNNYDYGNPVVGNYSWLTHAHELGHSFGLKHGQELGGPGNVAIPADRDALEYTVMTYRSYLGGPTTGYTNEQWGYPQTFMMSDIAALQTMYGADYTYRSGNTVYSWTPGSGITYVDGSPWITPGGNRIFLTIWDGGGVDTYDFSAYSTGVTIDLGPGDYSIASQAQLAYLGGGNYAHGNVYNAYLFQGDARSYIENAIGGSGNDFIYGNAVANVLTGNGGNDILNGGLGNDIIDGSAGIDRAFFSGNLSSYTISTGSGTKTVTGPDGTDTLTNVEFLTFADQTVAPVGQPPAGMDLNGDYNADFLWRADSGAVRVWDMYNAGIAADLGVAVIPTNWHIVGTDDFNHDGKTDLLWRADSGEVRLWEMNNAGIAADLGVAVIPTNWNIAATGDFNHDGYSDLLWRENGGAVRLWEMNGATSQADLGVAVVPTNWHIIGTDDFNHDGNTDLLWRENGGEVRLWEMNGANIQADLSVAVIPTNWHIVATGDFNGDGNADLVWRSDSGAVRIWEMNGANVQADLGVAAVPTNWHILGTSDFDGDGKSDLVWRADSGEVRVWEMNGANIQADVGVAVVPTNWTPVMHHYDIV